jgi:hypothetical protein
MDDIGIELRHTVLTISNVLQIISIVCSVLIALGYWFIRATDKTLDRVSLRLLVETCFFSLIFGITQLLLNIENTVDQEPECDAVMTFFVFSDLASALLMTCIAINLLLVICYESRMNTSRMTLEVCYTVGTTGFSAFIAVSPFFFPENVYSYSIELHQCWFEYSSPPKGIEIFWQLWTFHLWQMTGVVTTIVCFTIVLIKLRRDEISIDDNMESAENSVSKWFGPSESVHIKSFEEAEEIKETIPQSLKRQGTDLSQKCYFLKFFLPRSWFRKTERQKAVHAAISRNRRVSYVSKTIRQVICYVAGRLPLL